MAVSVGRRKRRLFHALYIVAIIVEAMTAALAAGHRRMDWVGVCMLAA
jgi:uncharacterized membrane protein YeiH